MGRRRNKIDIVGALPLQLENRSHSRSSPQGVPMMAALISKFWQNTHRRLHPLKKTAPEPALPLIGGSSHRCRAARATLGSASAPQYPRVFSLSTPQSRGQILQTPMNVSSYSGIPFYHNAAGIAVSNALLI